MSLQKESEWEGEMLKVFREGYQKRSREEDERFLLSAIATAVSNREKEIAEQVKRLREDNKTALNASQIERHIWAGFDEACKYFLQILKH